MVATAAPVTSPTSDTPRAASKPRVGSGWRGKQMRGWAFVGPAAVIVVGLFLVPLALLVYMSTQNWPLISNKHTYVGAKNYQQILHDPALINALKFTLYDTLITTVLIFAVSFVLVAVSNTKRRGARFYRTAFFLPYVVGTAAAALMWYINIDDQEGILNHALLSLHLISKPLSLLGTGGKATFATISLVVWKFIGFQVIVLLVGLQGIPGELYEAAKMDGASAWHRLRFITVPLLKPTLALLFMLSITGSLLAFDQFYVLTTGGPDNSTITLVFQLYTTAFVRFKLGAAAAMSIVLLVTLLLLNGVQLRLLRNKDAS